MIAKKEKILRHNQDENLDQARSLDRDMFCFNEGRVEKIKIIFNKSKRCFILILSLTKWQLGAEKFEQKSSADISRF